MTRDVIRMPEEIDDEGFRVFAEVKLLANKDNMVKFQFSCDEAVDRRMVAEMLENLADQLRAQAGKS